MYKYTIIIDEVIIKMEPCKYERAMQLNDKQFKLLTGVKKQTAVEMVEILGEAYAAKHKRRGRHAKLSVELMLMLTLEYWRQYVTFFELAFAYGVAESTAHDIVVWVENVLIQHKEVHVPGKKALLNDPSIEVVLVDVTESPVERPKRGRRIGILERKSGIQ